MTTACNTQNRGLRGNETGQWFGHFNEAQEILLSIARQLGQA